MADFYIDNDVAVALAPELRSWGHAARTTRDVGRGAASDDDQLLFAAQNGWVLVTCNRKDFILLHDAWVRWSAAWRASEQHAGILVVPQPRPLRELTRDLHHFIQTGPPLANQL